MTQPGFTFGKLGGKAGLVLAAIGLATIGIGWNLAAGQAGGDLRLQFPYLLSAGLTGLAFVILGAAMLVVQGAREDRALLEAKLDLLTEAIYDGAAREPRAAGTPGDLSGLVVAGSASYHAPGCRLVDGREETGYLTPAEARGRDLKACRVCQPESIQTNVTVR
ncbi:MAG TPA: hypothetical protein VNA30_03745 [Mycobacteriales bacterium]|nr:hypothetical protein [Mycobacteriales bacterium]